MRSTLGCFGYNRPFVEGYVEIAQPLTRLTKKDVPFEWTLECTECYNLGSSLHKKNDFQGKDGLTSALRNLTSGLAWMNAKDDVSRVGVGSSKG